MYTFISSSTSNAPNPNAAPRCFFSPSFEYRSLFFINSCWSLFRNSSAPAYGSYPMPQLLSLTLIASSFSPPPPPPPPNSDTSCCPYRVLHACSSSFVALNTILPFTFFLRLPKDFPTLHPIFTNNFVPMPLMTGLT